MEFLEFILQCYTTFPSTAKNTSYRTSIPWDTGCKLQYFFFTHINFIFFSQLPCPHLSELLMIAHFHYSEVGTGRNKNILYSVASFPPDSLIIYPGYIILCTTQYRMLWRAQAFEQGRLNPMLLSLLSRYVMLGDLYYLSGSHFHHY